MTLLQYFILGVVITPCVIHDLRGYQIPNMWILFGWIAGALYQISQRGFMGILFWLLSLLLPILILLPLYLLRVLGAGDIKLFSVVIGILGWKSVPGVLAASFLCAAAMSLLHMARKRTVGVRLLYFQSYCREVFDRILLKPHQGQQLRSVLKQLPPYYDKSRDGYDAVIHFSLAIVIGIVGSEVLVW